MAEYEGMQIETARTRLERAAVAWAERDSDDTRIELERASRAFWNAKRYVPGTLAQRVVELRVEDFDEEAATLSGEELGGEAG